MNVACYSAKSYDRRFLDAANASRGHTLTYIEPRLTLQTASLARGYSAVCAFVGDQLDAPVLRELARGGTELIALRSAGYNHVDLAAAKVAGLTVVNVPRYSPHAVAEHTIALILALNRHIHRAHNRVREGNFSIDGFLGFDLHGKTVGLVGAGAIGTIVGRILLACGCHVLAADPAPSEEARSAGFEWAERERILTEAEIVTLHCPLTPETRHLIDAAAIARMKRGIMLINTSRGGLVDTRAVIDGLIDGKIGYVGLDVYEDEAELFYEDHSNRVLTDRVFSRLITLPNVLVTGHQGFFTHEALTNIAETTLTSIGDFAAGRRPAPTLIAPA